MTTSLHLTSVSGNVKLGVDCRDLGPRVLVVGKNGVGKTSVLQAMELLLTGGCSIGRKPSTLAALATDGARELAVGGNLSTGSELSFRISGTAARASRPVWTRDGVPVSAPVGACMTDLVGPVLRGDPAQTLRPALIRVACGGIDVPRLAAQVVPEVFLPTWTDVWHRCRAGAGSDADALAACAEALRAEARGAKRAAGAVAGDVVEAPDEVEVDRLQAELGRVREWYRVEAERGVAAAGIRALWPVLPDAGDGAAVPWDLLAAALSGADAVHRFLEARAAAGAKLACLACERGLDAPALPGLRERLTRRASDVAAASTEAVARSRARQRYRDLRAREDELAGRLRVLGPEPSGSVVELEDRLVALISQRERAKLAAEGRRNAASAASRADAAKALSQAADRMVAEALGGGIAAFEAAVNARLADGKVKFVLFDGDKPACRIAWTGKVRGVEVTAPLQTLSGAQEADVVRAFACAWAARESSEVKLVPVDDVWFDRDHLRGVLAGFDGADEVSQAVVCAVDDYGLEVNGWTVVRVG